MFQRPFSFLFLILFVLMDWQFYQELANSEKAFECLDQLLKIDNRCFYFESDTDSYDLVLGSGCDFELPVTFTNMIFS